MHISGKRREPQSANLKAHVCTPRKRAAHATGTPRGKRIARHTSTRENTNLGDARTCFAYRLRTRAPAPPLSHAPPGPLSLPRPGHWHARTRKKLLSTRTRHLPRPHSPRPASARSPLTYSRAPGLALRWGCSNLPSMRNTPAIV